MKLYSKKYLAMMLAGVLATSTPVATFANANDEESAVTVTESPSDQSTTSNTTNATDTDSQTTNSSENKDSNSNTVSTQTNNTWEAPSSTIEVREDRRPSDFLNLPDGAKIISGDERFDRESGTRRITVEFADKSTKTYTIYFKTEGWNTSKSDLRIRNLKYDGRNVSGTTEPNATIYLDDGRDTKRLGTSRSNGEFSFDVRLYTDKIAYVYAEKDGVKGESQRIDVSDKNGKSIDATNLRLSGETLSGYVKNYPFENIKIYLGSRLVGSTRADKDGYFSTRLNERIYDRDLDDLSFYVEKDTNVVNKDLKVTEANEGEKLLKGTTKGGETVTVFSADKELGTIDAARTGDFTVYLNRALVAGEKLTIESKDKDGKVSKIDFIVRKKASQTQLGYIVGYPDGSFKPSANVTRAEAAQMFATLINGGTNFGTSKTTKFSDANDGWYSEAINFVVNKGLISGYSDGTFKPDQKITRAEFAQMISGYIKDGTTKNSTFADTKEHWAKDAVDKLYGNKNIKGYPDGSFKPNSNITRAESVTILNSVFNRVTTKDSLNNVNISGLKTFNDVDDSHWAYYNVLDASNTHKSEKAPGNSDVDIWK